jgi:hypothetical protein
MGFSHPVLQFQAVVFSARQEKPFLFMGDELKERQKHVQYRLSLKTLA